MKSFRTKMTDGADPSQPPILITGGAGYIGSPDPRLICGLTRVI